MKNRKVLLDQDSNSDGPLKVKFHKKGKKMEYKNKPKKNKHWF